MVVLDFETEAIGPPPNGQPIPVGLAVLAPGLGPIYLSWGHPEGNNATKQIAADLLARIWEGGEPLLFHNARFDVAVARKHFGLSWPSPDRVEDTLYHLFLNDPLASTLSLKPSAERILRLPPTEQNALRDWLVNHRVVPYNTKEWGAYISKAPAQIVGPYAIGDVKRTLALAEVLGPRTESAGMTEAYRREQQLAPILNCNEEHGVRVDLEGLERDVTAYEAQFDKASREILRLLKASDINLDSGTELADALQRSGKVDLSKWTKTPTGKLSTARDVLQGVITDPYLYSLVAYRGALKSCLTTFYRPWIEQAQRCGGRLHPSWNSVRGDYGGTRTGRLSSYGPNFQNIPKEFPEGATIPDKFLPLPVMRKYILPDEGQIFVSADFHSQEVRVLGHFAEGAIAQIYRDNPRADVHAVASELIHDSTGVYMDRKAVKIIAFSILYGAGVRRIAESLGVDQNTAARMKRAYLDTLTGVRELQMDVEARAVEGGFVRSWGGRMLRAPAAELRPDGGIWDKNYVLVNYLIQGSAADQTKEALVRHGNFLITVHDEICLSVLRKQLKSEIKRLKESMEGMKGWDLPMRVEVSVGQNWAELEEYK